MELGDYFTDIIGLFSTTVI